MYVYWSNEVVETYSISRFRFQFLSRPDYRTVICINWFNKYLVLINKTFKLRSQSKKNKLWTKVPIASSTHMLGDLKVNLLTTMSNSNMARCLKQNWCNWCRRTISNHGNVSNFATVQIWFDFQYEFQFVSSVDVRTATPMQIY